MNITKDNQEIELEAKNLLTKEEFLQLCNHFLVGHDNFVEQENRYFADQEGIIPVNLPIGTTLRVREKKGALRLEFKLPEETGEVAEYSDALSEDQFQSLLHNGKLPEGNVKKVLYENGILEPILFLGIARTLRATPQNDWGVEISLDETSYPGGSKDYEIEIESSSLERSHEVLLEILNEFEIQKIDSPRKIERFYKATKK